MVSQGFFSGSDSAEKRSQRFAGQKENKVALGGDNLGSFGGVGAVIGVGALGIKGIQSAVEGGKRLKENIERRFNPERKTSYVSPRGNEVAQLASSDISGLKVGSPEVRLANVKSYTEGSTKPYSPKDPVYDAINKYDSKPDTRTQDEKDQDAIKKFFTRKDGGVFKDNDEFDRKMTTYGTDADGNPTATNAFGEKVNYSTEKIKRNLVQDAKEDQAAKEKQKLETAYQKKLKAEDSKTASVLTNKYGDDMRSYINPNVPPGTRINPDTGMQEIPKYYQKTTANPLTDPTNPNYLGDDVVPKSLRESINVEKAKEAVDKALSYTEKTKEPSKGFTQKGTDTGSTVSIKKKKKKPGSKKSSRGAKGGSSSRSRGGISRGRSKSNTGSKKSSRGASGSSSSRSRGGTGSGRTKTSRTASKASRSRTGRSRTRCDIRTKINISPLINSNLVKDNLAELAYFVQELKK